MAAETAREEDRKGEEEPHKVSFTLRQQKGCQMIPCLSLD